MKAQLIGKFTEEKAESIASELAKVKNPEDGNLWINYGKARVYYNGRAGLKGMLDLLTGKYSAKRTQDWKYMHDMMEDTNFSY